MTDTEEDTNDSVKLTNDSVKLTNDSAKLTKPTKGGSAKLTSPKGWVNVSEAD
jgi:hypothetical protein